MYAWWHNTGKYLAVILAPVGILFVLAYGFDLTDKR